MLDVWMALGGDPATFEEWMDNPKRTPADAWAQLLAAIRGDLMNGDHNPEPGLILKLVRQECPRCLGYGEVAPEHDPNGYPVICPECGGTGKARYREARR
jgi:hypothetical protein